MKSKVKLVGTAESNIVTSTEFVLKPRPALPVQGLHTVTIGEIKKETGTEGGKEINRIRKPILGLKDSNGNAYALDKFYNIGANGRGLNTLFRDYSDWSGVEVPEMDIPYFNCNAVMQGKPVVVEIRHRAEGKKVVAVVKGFHPADYTEPAADAETQAAAEVALA